MKIRMLVSRSGARGAFSVGQEVDLPTAEAKRLIAAGKARPVRDQRVETTAAATPAAETTAQASTSRKRASKPEDTSDDALES